MKSGMLNSMVVMAIFVVLAIPATIAAQTEQEHNCNQPALKNLDTPGGASTIDEGSSDAGSGIADTRPDANTLYRYGRCEVNSSTNTLTGICRQIGPRNDFIACALFRPQQCPPGARAISPGNDFPSCNHVVFVDWAVTRTCGPY